MYLKVPPVEELDGVLGTKRWMVRKGEGGEEAGRRSQGCGVWWGVGLVVLGSVRAYP